LRVVDPLRSICVDDLPDRPWRKSLCEGDLLEMASSSSHSRRLLEMATLDDDHVPKMPAQTPSVELLALLQEASAARQEQLQDLNARLREVRRRKRELSKASSKRRSDAGRGCPISGGGGGGRGGRGKNTKRRRVSVCSTT
jgi:hypothetical protein